MQENKVKISPAKIRFLEYLDNKNISKYKFYKESGVSKGILESKGGLSEDTLVKILTYAVDLCPNWLLIGKGEMYLPNSSGLSSIANSFQKEPGVNLLSDKESEMQLEMMKTLANLTSEVLRAKNQDRPDYMTMLKDMSAILERIQGPRPEYMNVLEKLSVTIDRIDKRLDTLEQKYSAIEEEVRILGGQKKDDVAQAG